MFVLFITFRAFTSREKEGEVFLIFPEAEALGPLRFI